MKTTPNRLSLILITSVSLFIILATYLISLFARGYRFSLKDGFSSEPTGMISAVSRPKGASVYLDDKLITATDDTINLPPGVYQLKITKDGFLPWQKTVTIKPETVYQADIQLFSTVPNLKPITLTGAINPAVNTDNTKIIYAVASASATKDELYNLYDCLYNCDLLIIDDLGTETVNSFVASSLFALINERHLRKKSTIISTNLSLEQIRDIYSDRVFSRIANSYSLLRLVADDIRIQKKQLNIRK